LPDIVAVFESDRAALSALFAEVAIDKGDIILGDMGAFASKLTTVAPGVVASLIAAGADEPDVSIAASLPFPVQVEALEQIGKLTFATEGAAKKVMETVIRMVKGATTAASARVP
jgi:hypothetical protein